MKKILIIIIIISLSGSVWSQNIPTIKVSTSEFEKDFSSIRNNTYDDNIIGKKITLTRSKTKLEWHSSKDGAYSIFEINIETNIGFGLIVYFDQLELPKGSSIRAFSYNKLYSTKIFYHNFNKQTSSFAMPLIKSNKLTLEARIPTVKIDEFISNISEIGCIPINSREESGFGATESCFVNVNCSDAADWQNQKRAVVKYTYTIGGDIGICTGSFINNTAQDNRNLFLSAQHCAQEATTEELGQTIFYFNYESSDCDNPLNDDNLDDETVIGCIRLAGSGPVGPLPPNGSDFHLFEVNPIPESYNVYYAGWNRNDVGALSGPGAIIQHPLADIKKISFVSGFQQAIDGSDLEAVIKYSASGSGGAVEANSSGSGIFDGNKLIVATVSYGSTGCYTGSYASGDGGKFFSHWDQNGTEANRQLKPWLDPSNTGVMTLDGKNAASVGIEKINQSKNDILIYPNPAYDNIYIECKKAENINKVKVSLININGTLVFEDDVYINENYMLNRIDIRNLKHGIYFITISNFENQFYKSSKFIKY